VDAALRDELKAEVDATWAEAVRHLPMAGPDPDSTRDVVVFEAVLRTGEREGVDVRSGRAGRADREGGQVMAGGAALRLDRVAWPDLVLRGGDKIVALDRPGEPLFEILAVDDRHHLRLICQLGDAN
jgi:hypothetical protein